MLIPVEDREGRNIYGRRKKQPVEKVYVDFVLEAWYNFYGEGFSNDPLKNWTDCVVAIDNYNREKDLSIQRTNKLDY